MSHITVMRCQAVAALMTDNHGVYVDATFGRGGHSQLILDNLTDQGQLIAFDQDLAAIQHANHAIVDSRFTTVHASFTDLKYSLQRLGVESIHGILFDLGVSSPQLDQSERGFSFLHDGPLDMRMNLTTGQSAADWLADVEQTVLADTIYQYGEEKYSRRIAKAIVESRQHQPITTTKQLADIVAAAHPRWEAHKHPATRTFQAIRIFINDEMTAIETVLPQALETLAIGGRMVVISFHSLEDRIVKRFIQQHATVANDSKYPLSPEQTQSTIRLKKIGKFHKPSQDEVAANVRSRSAVLRIAEKIA